MGKLLLGSLLARSRSYRSQQEFDYDQQFWQQVELSPGGPSARWGAVGGRDPRTPSITSPTLTTPNNSFYLAGGFDGQNTLPLSDMWQLNVTGTISSNNLNNVQASWEKLSISTQNVPSETGPAGAVVSQGSSLVVSVGGCSSSSSPSTSCADQDTFIIDTGSDNVNHPAGCPAPRLGGTMALNMNTASSAFGAQIFLLLGTIDTSLWQDDGGLERGEVVRFHTSLTRYPCSHTPILGRPQREHRFDRYLLF